MLTLKRTINLKSVSSASFFTPITHVQERMDKGKSHTCARSVLLSAEHKQIYMYITYV